MMSRRGEAEPALDLPPGYRVISLRESGDAFAHGLAIAAEAGAGTLIRVGRYDLVEFAVILEPDEPLVSARRAFFAGMNAIGDAIAAHCPPEHEVSFAWPDTILFDQGLLGGARLGWPPDCAENDVPAWLALAATATTWALVMMSPSVVRMMPEPSYAILPASVCSATTLGSTFAATCSTDPPETLAASWDATGAALSAALCGN